MKLAQRVLILTMRPALIPSTGSAYSTNRASACEARFPYGLLMWWHGVLLLLSTAFIGWRLTKADARELLSAGGPLSGDLKRLLAFQALVAVAILLNAFLCGALSGPFPRYEARLIWLWPLGPLLMAGLLGWPRPQPLQIATGPAWFGRPGSDESA